MEFEIYHARVPSISHEPFCKQKGKVGSLGCPLIACYLSNLLFYAEYLVVSGVQNLSMGWVLNIWISKVFYIWLVGRGFPPCRYFNFVVGGSLICFWLLINFSLAKINCSHRPLQPFKNCISLTHHISAWTRPKVFGYIKDVWTKGMRRDLRTVRS